MKNIYGTMNIPSENFADFLKEIFDAGYNWIDAAWIYGSGENEKQIGNALEELGEQVNFKIQTKIWRTDYDRVEEAFKGQLESLKVDKVDSLLLHRPTRDFNKSINAWKKLIEFKEKGLVDVIGVSNFDKDMINILVEETGVKPEINQFEFSVLNGRFDRIKYAMDNSIEAQAWSPLSGWVEEVLGNAIVQEIAQKHNAKPAQILLAYVRSFGVAPVIGTTIASQAIENLNLVEIDMEDVQKLGLLNEWRNRFSEGLE